MKRKVLLLVTSYILILGMAGCGISNKGKNIETRYFSQNIQGEKEYRDDNNEEVLEILEFIEKFVDSYFNSDYRNPDSYLKESDFYSNEMKLKREKNGYKDNTVRQMDTYQIIREFSDLDIEEVEFYKVNGVESVEVAYTFAYTFKNCTQAYLEKTQKQLNTPYKMRYRVILQKENNNWCVSKIVVKENLN